MALKDLTDPEAVIAAMREFDRSSPEEFMASKSDAASC